MRQYAGRRSGQVAMLATAFIAMTIFGFDNAEGDLRMQAEIASLEVRDVKWSAAAEAPVSPPSTGRTAPVLAAMEVVGRPSAGTESPEGAPTPEAAGAAEGAVRQMTCYCHPTDIT